MVRLVLVTLIALFSVSRSQDKVCVSGFDGQNTNRIVNGEYTQIAFNRGRYVYQRINDCNPGEIPKLYIFWDGGWYMGPGDPAQDPPYTNYAVNSINQMSVCGGTANFPYECSAWNPGVTVTNGPCPRATCASITLSAGIATSCDGTLQYYAVNQYKASNSEWVFWFDKYFDRWVCTKEIDISNCGATSSEQGISVQNTDGYEDLTTNPSIQWNAGDNLNQQITNLNVQCSGTQVSKAPTGATPEPTSIPTKTGTIGSYCLWGHDRVFSFVNGLYVYDGELNGHPYYARINRDDNCPSQYGEKIYLYYVDGINSNQYGNSTWYISDILGASWEKLIYGLCRNFNVGLDPRNCDNQWHFGEFATAGGQLSASAATVDYTCPSVPCDAIEWDVPNCPGPFTEKVEASPLGQRYVAVYKNPSSGHYLYFNENYFGWWCDKPQEFLMRDCDNPIVRTSERVWYAWSNGLTQPVLWNLPSGTMTSSIRCYNGSPHPTISGQTENPTKYQVIRPPTKARVITASPTKTGQTYSPTEKIFTANPTQDLIGTRSPTKNPASSSPTENPTAWVPGTPSQSPNVQTPSPTKNPAKGGPSGPSGPSGPTSPTRADSNIISFTFNIFIVLVFSLLLM